MSRQSRESTPHTPAALSPVVRGRARKAQRHPHAGLVGLPEADTVMFALPKADTQLDEDSERESTKVLEAIPGTTAKRQESRPSPRRTWVSRACLLAILAMQAILSLRLQNTAFEDEGLYLYVGHLEIAHWLPGASLQGDYPSYLSGAPVLYPVLGAMADGIGGLAAARAVSLMEMLSATAMLYGLSRRLFNERVALCAALTFAVAAPTLFLGHFATYDASALFLLALATWMVVRTAEFRWPVYLLAAPVMTLAVATKYASLLFVPCVIAFAGLAAWPRLRRKALIPPAALTVAVVGLLIVALKLAGADYMKGIDFTTLQRANGGVPTTHLLWDCLQWIGVPFGLAVIGAVAYTISPFTERGEKIAAAGSRLRHAGARRADPNPHRGGPAEARGLRAVLCRPDGRPRPGARHRRPLPPGPDRRAGVVYGTCPRAEPGRDHVRGVEQLDAVHIRPDSLPGAGRALPHRGGRGPDLLPAALQGRPARPVHIDLLHRLRQLPGHLPDRQRGLYRGDQGRLLPHRLLQLRDDDWRRQGHRERT